MPPARWGLKNPGGPMGPSGEWVIPSLRGISAPGVERGGCIGLSTCVGHGSAVAMRRCASKTIEIQDAPAANSLLVRDPSRVSRCLRGELPLQCPGSLFYMGVPNVAKHCQTPEPQARSGARHGAPAGRSQRVYDRKQRFHRQRPPFSAIVLTHRCPLTVSPLFVSQCLRGEKLPQKNRKRSGTRLSKRVSRT